jgi:hypothetical protein
MRFHSGDQVQNLGLPDLPMYCPGIDQICRQSEHVVESMADIAERRICGVEETNACKCDRPDS